MIVFHKIVKATGLKKFFFKENIKEYIAVATPDISTTNLGDKIIADAVFKQLRSVLPEKFFIQFPTQCVLVYGLVSFLGSFCGGRYFFFF